MMINRKCLIVLAGGIHLLSLDNEYFYLHKILKYYRTEEHEPIRRLEFGGRMFRVASTFTKPHNCYRFSLRLLSSEGESKMPVRDTTPMLAGLRRCMKDRKFTPEPLHAYIVPR